MENTNDLCDAGTLSKQNDVGKPLQSREMDFIERGRKALWIGADFDESLLSASRKRLPNSAEIRSYQSIADFRSPTTSG
jgi:hypothetical protein